MKSPKLMVIGLDALPLEILDRYTASGAAPTLKFLMEKGVSGHALPDFPPYTPNNWAVIGTGASCAANGTVEWFKTVEGEFMSTFDSRAYECESIFAAAAGQNLTTLAIQYPGSYPPPDPDKNIVLAPLDKGLVSYAMYAPKMILAGVAAGEAGIVILGGRGEVELSTRGGAGEGAKGFASLLAKFVGATEDSSMVIDQKLDKEMHEYIVWKAELKEEGGRFTGIVLDTGNGEKEDLPLDAWSRFFLANIPTSSGILKGVFRLKAYSGPVEGKLRIVRSEVYDASAIASDPELAEDLLKQLGGFFEHTAFGKRLKKIDAPNFHEILAETLEELEYQVDWVAGAARRVQETRGWDIFYLHWHWPDTVLHDFLQFYDPSAPGYKKEYAPRAEKVIEETMRLCDRLVAGLLKCAGPDTVICVVSDHGNSANHYEVNINKRLVQAGLAVYDEKGRPDRKKSLAYMFPLAPISVRVNTEARGGPVKAGDYEKIQEKVLDALLDWKTEDGKRVMALALKKKDSFLLNYWGKLEGDVFFHCNPGFFWMGKELLATVSAGANHGSQMPTTYTSHTSNMDCFVIAGPKIKSGFRWDSWEIGPFRLVDLVPTLCRAAGINPPGDVTGAPRNKVFNQLS